VQKDDRKARFSRPVLLKRVKSCGSCQALSSQLSVISNQSSVLIDPPTCNSRTEMAVKRWPRGVFRVRRVRPKAQGQPVDSGTITCQIPQPKEQRHAESKGLTSHVLLPPGRLRTTSPGFLGQPKCGVGNLLIRLCLMADLMGKTGEGLLNLKDLLSALPASGRAASARFVGPAKRCEADLLIPQGLMSSLLRRTSEACSI